MLNSILEMLVSFAVNTISFFGYVGVFVLMMLESTLFPIPSELVMPFAGYLAFQGKMQFWLVVLIGGIAGVVGSLVSYYIGYYGGNAFIKNFGRYFLIHEEDMHWTISWFKRHGEKTIFISRFIPIIRHLISIPAGIARMDLKKFVIYTFIGATMWSLILTSLGYYLGSRWEDVHVVAQKFDYMIIGIIALVIIWFVWRHLNRKSK